MTSAARRARDMSGPGGKKRWQAKKDLRLSLIDSKTRLTQSFRSLSRTRVKFSGIRSIARNASFLTAARATNIIARTCYVILVARLLGPELYAMLAYSQSWYLAFMPVAIYGMNGLMIRLIGLNKRLAPDIAARALTIRIFTTAVAAMLCVSVGWWLSPDRESAMLITVLTFALLARGVTAWAQALFNAFEVSYHQMRQELIFRVIELTSATTILLLGGDVLLLVIAHAIVWWAQATRAFYIVRRDLVPIGFRWSVSE